MTRTSLAILLCASASATACGEVDKTSGADAGVRDGGGGATTYRGALAQTSPVMFGGTSDAGTFCNYTITLKDLAIELAILPSKQVVSGAVQALNSEAADAKCTFDTIPENTAKYSYAPVTPVAVGTTLSFTGDAANKPSATLTVDVVSVGSAFQANLAFHRADGVQEPLKWTVIASLPVTP